MGRKKRLWIPNAFYHIVCRGNRREPLFHDDGDFKTFFYILSHVHEKTPFELASYCLMSNHFHLQLRSTEHSISKVMMLINKRYADYYNTKNNLTGHVFEKRFFGEIIDSNVGMIKVSRYIHLNPVKAKIVAKPEEYPWSSYRYLFYNPGVFHQMLNMDQLLTIFIGNTYEKRKKYQNFVEGD